MTGKTYVLDTSVLLHDPEVMRKFVFEEVVIPLVVLEELDSMKRLHTELGKNARQVIRFLSSLKGDLFKGICLSSQQMLFVYADANKEMHRNFSLHLDQKTHRIVFTAYQLKEEGKEVVILLSKDFVLRLKAESIGIQTQDYESVQKKDSKLYRGWRQIEVPKQKIDYLGVKGSVEFPDLSFSPNEYCYLESSCNTALLGKYNSQKGIVEPVPYPDEPVWGISPLNLEQKCALDLLLRDDIQLITLVGQAGTGKTLLALICGLRKIFDEEVYRRMVISRPIMPLGKDIGYLPGTKEEKMYHWMQPIYDNLEVVCDTHVKGGNRSSSKEWVLQSDRIEMEAVTFIRGRSFSNVYLMIDEAQNLTPHEIKAIISRAGKGTKVVLTGDPTQIDNPYLDREGNALTYVIEKFTPHSLYGHIFFEKTERSPLAALAAEVL